MRFRWSPLFETNPLGGPSNQPKFVNAVVVVDGEKLQALKPSAKNALDLLEKFLALERDYGRDRKKTSMKWGPRSLDLDLLAWGDLNLQSTKITLPHPRIFERNFVVIPLAAAMNQDNQKLIKISPQDNWPE